MTCIDYTPHSLGWGRLALDYRVVAAFRPHSMNMSDVGNTYLFPDFAPSDDYYGDHPQSIWLQYLICSDTF